MNTSYITKFDPLNVKRLQSQGEFSSKHRSFLGYGRTIYLLKEYWQDRPAGILRSDHCADHTALKIWATSWN